MKSQTGFTLTELLVVITIAAILAAIATPSLQNFVRDSRITTVTNLFISHLSLARSEAITRRTGVAICQSPDPDANPPLCSGTTNTWTTGWLVFVNVGGSSPPEFDGGAGEGGVDVLIKIGEAISGDITLSTNIVAASQIEYDIDGTSTVQLGQTASFVVCDTRGADFGRQIDVDGVGRSTLTKAHPGNPLGSCFPAE